MKHARLLFALTFAGAAACSAAEATGPVAESPRSSSYMGSGTDVLPDTTKTQTQTQTDTTKQQS